MNAQPQLRKYWAALLAVIVLAAGTVGSQTPAARQPQKTETAEKPAASRAPRNVKLDLTKAIAVNLPQGQDLKAAAFTTPDGKTGWVIRIPGGRPIATPAFANGRIFVGGGYGSHEFYAFDARTGALAWKINTGDDGPTAAVVEDGYVAFNTESCTLIVVDEKTGKVIWQEWLGDPLMSQPAIAQGRIFIAYPAGQRKQSAVRSELSHRLLAADLRTGKHLWEQPIPADVISAPVVSDGTVYVTCFEGTSYAFRASDGALLWKKANAGTSAPVVSDGSVIMTRKEMRNGKAYEGLARLDPSKGDVRDRQLIAAGEADHLAKGKGGGVGIKPEATAHLDASVGFATAPAAANLKTADAHVGVSSVVGAWAYQGSRAAAQNGRVLNAQGRYINSVNSKTGAEEWRAEVHGGNAENAQAFAPPALGREYMYLAGPGGYLVTVRQKDGATGMVYAMKRPVAFQPVLALGNIYLGTADGHIICLQTGGQDAEGWHAWGGNAQHNR